MYRDPSSSIQTVLSVPESHRVSLDPKIAARGLERLRAFTAGREFHPALKMP